MLAVLSPSKKLEKIETFSQATQPQFFEDSKVLIERMKDHSAAEIGRLMKLSEKLSDLNHLRYQEFSLKQTEQNSSPAMLTFQGDVYDGLDAGTLSPKAFNFANDHLRILSGLYGLLRPTDLIQPYRLEMGIKLRNSRGKDLYEFWGDQLTDAINQQLQTLETPTLLNLASNEYFKALQPKKIQGNIITATFKEERDGGYKMLMLYVKRARGAFARFVLENQITNAEHLKDFAEDGYGYNKSLSDEQNLVFTRKS